MTELEKLDSLSGLISNDQGREMARLASCVPPDQAIVEIGSYKGKSACFLAYGAGLNGAHVYTIDLWDSPENVDGKHHYASSETRIAFKNAVHLMGYEDRITSIQGSSTSIAKAWKVPGPRNLPVGLLYIDGDHSEESVKSDFTSWYPHLATNTIVIFDDLDTKKNPGVRVVVDKIIDKGLFTSFEKIKNIGVFKR